MAEILELASFILMIYAGGIALYVSRKAVHVNSSLFVLSLLLAATILFHGIHHLFAFIQARSLEFIFEFAAASSALSLAVVYAYLWRHS